MFPIGGGITRRIDSNATAKSWRLNEIIARSGHMTRPNVAATPIPTRLMNGNGISPNIGGIALWTAFVSAFPADTMISSEAPMILPATGVFSR
jgi:hypothetical protein